jgi:lipid-binding SYLF domain-containing protein
MKRLVFAAALIAAPMLAPVAAYADPPQELVDSSTLSIENIFRGAFIVGGEGGDCVMVARAAAGSWSDPAFYNLGSGSFGFQIGVQNAQVMMMIMTDGGLNALLNSQFKFGADAGLTLATLGAGVNGSMSTALDADIITFSRSQGLYGGISLAGSVLSNDAAAEQNYYGSVLDARQIVVEMNGSNPGANPLRAMLSKYGG